MMLYLVLVEVVVQVHFVGYLMGITNVDPIKYGLIFERFISPNREDFPDIDC